MFAESSTPSTMSNLSMDESKKDSKENVDSEESVEHGWWKEAIKAEEAWDNLDDTKKKVKVGVLETNKLGADNHVDNIADNDIRDSTEVISESVNSEYEYEDKRKGGISTHNHPRWVTKFIVADKKKKPKNFRGVAYGFADIKFTAIDAKVKHYKTNEKIKSFVKFNKVPEPYIFSKVKINLEKGIKIINLSLGTPPITREAWKNTEKEEKRYGKYRDIHKKNIDKVSADLIVVLDELLSKEKGDSSNPTKKEFLIIQAGGNGKTLYRHETDESKDEERSVENAIEAKYSGYFANINKQTYKKATDLLKGKLIGKKTLNHNLDEILDHIIIVGGVEMKDKDKDTYQTPDWASYGNAIDIVAPAEDLHIDIDQTKGTWGTSYATPMVSGAAALVWAHDTKLKAGEVKDLLLSSAVDDVIDNLVEVDYKRNRSSYPMLDVTAFMNVEPPNSNYLKEDTENLAKNEEEQDLSDNEIEGIVADNLSKIEPIIFDATIVELFNKYYDMEDESEIWKSGVDPNHPFYQEAYDRYYPELEGSVAKEGMASIIKEMLFISLVPTNPSWTFGPSYELEVLSQDSENFKVKQSKAIGEQDSDGIADYIIHDLEYVKEDGKWKFAGAENINKNNYPLENH